jgi:hypothetical protein
MDIRRQLGKADGLLGYGLDAKLVQRTFWSTNGDRLPVTWDQARSRVRDAAA